MTSSNPIVANAIAAGSAAVCNYDLSGYDRMVKEYFTKASKAAKKGDSIAAAGLIIKANAIIEGVRKDIEHARMGEGNEGLIATAQKFIDKWEPVKRKIPSSTKGWDGNLTIPNGQNSVVATNKQDFTQLVHMLYGASNTIVTAHDVIDKYMTKEESKSFSTTKSDLDKAYDLIQKAIKAFTRYNQK